MTVKNWGEAFFIQARSDLKAMDALDGAGDLPDCHRFHYLQMTSEKLAKAILFSNAPSSERPEFKHSALVAALRRLKTNPRLRRAMGFRTPRQFGQYVDSLLATAKWIEQLAPSAAGMENPNPEYPWIDAKSGDIHIPADDFAIDGSVNPAHLAKVEGLLRSLIHNGIF
ncbi:MAG: hypothetical protein ACP5I8_16940 [Phycisphaerae bacterium]